MLHVVTINLYTRFDVVIYLPVPSTSLDRSGSNLAQDICAYLCAAFVSFMQKGRSEGRTVVMGVNAVTFSAYHETAKQCLPTVRVLCHGVDNWQFVFRDKIRIQ